MITIALDEAGIFEAYKSAERADSKTTLIGGILYDSGDSENSNDEKHEKERINAFYRTIVADLNQKYPGGDFKFPQDLHSNGKNNKKAGQVKSIVKKYLPEFIQTGTIDGNKLFDEKGNELPDREGKYLICAVVKSKDGKTNLVKGDKDNFFRDDLGSNLYYHMASDVVEHFITRNPVYKDIGKLTLNIASRHSEVWEKPNDVYDKIGVTKKDKEVVDEEGGVKHKVYQYVLMSGDIFRTILTEQLINTRNSDIEISEFKVNSITYQPNRAKAHAFLYLSDSVCSYLSTGEKDSLKIVLDKAKRLCPETNLVFAYDEVDLYFKRAWQAVEIGEYYDAIKELYNIEIMNTDEAKLYKEYWIKYVKDRIKTETQNKIKESRMPYTLIEAVSELRDSYMTNGLKPSEAKYIFETLEDVAKGIPNEAKYQRLLYNISDCGVMANCHEGNLVGAKPYFQKCEKYAGAVMLEEYTRTRNRYATALSDGFKYDEAISVVRVTLDLLSGMYLLSKEKLGSHRKSHFGKLELAKTLSLAGQIASFIGDDEALNFFADALKMMDDNVANQKITESYRLHYVIDVGDKEKYLSYLEEYTNGFSSIEGQLADIDLMSSQDEINISYALYMYLKGLYKYYSDDEIKKVWKKLLKLEQSVEPKRKTDHPWELIYKYLGLLAVRMGESDLSKEYGKKIKESVNASDESLVIAIAMFSEAELLEVVGDNSKAKKQYDKVYKMLEENFDAFNPEKVIVKNTAEKIEYMKKKFVYMYS